MAKVKNVTLSQLEAHLWEAANILRGPVDASDWLWQDLHENYRFITLKPVR